jgi:hypothetical protein
MGSALRKREIPRDDRIPSRGHEGTPILCEVRKLRAHSRLWDVRSFLVQVARIGCPATRWSSFTLASWRLGVLASWRLGVLASWRLGVLASWRLGVLASWRRRVVASSCRRVVVSSCRRVVVSSCRRVVVSSCRRVVVSSCRRVVVSCRVVASSRLRDRVTVSSAASEAFVRDCAASSRMSSEGEALSFTVAPMLGPAGREFRLPTSISCDPEQDASRSVAGNKHGENW